MVVPTGETVCVTGAAGYVGSWLVMRLLERGYTARATVRDPGNMRKVKHLLDLPNAKTQLTLWKADLNDEGSFDTAIHGCSGVFHVATPTYFDATDPENKVIKPTVSGVLDIMKACAKAKVRRLVFTSSAAAVSIEENQKPMYDETCWTDVEFCRSNKMLGWMYLVSKTLAEKAAWSFAAECHVELISVIPTLVVGPFLIPTMPPSLVAALCPLTRNEAYYSMIMRQGHFVHLDDVCMAHIFLYEHAGAHGRYIVSASNANVYDIGKMLKETYPEFNVPTKFKDCDENMKSIHLSSKKLTELGFEFKYDLKDMYIEAIEACQAKGFLSTSVENHANDSD